jgi:hypothetical protein
MHIMAIAIAFPPGSFYLLSPKTKQHEMNPKNDLAIYSDPLG